MKKVFSDSRCNVDDVIEAVIKYLESLKNNKYINEPFTIIVEIIDENKSNITK